MGGDAESVDGDAGLGNLIATPSELSLSVRSLNSVQLPENARESGDLETARILAARALRKVVGGTRLDELRSDASATGIGEEFGPSGKAAKPVLRPHLAEQIIRDAIDVMQFEMDKLHNQKAFEDDEHLVEIILD